MTASPILSFENINVEYEVEGTITKALSNFSLDIFPNELICLVGQSGCGKSTALNLAAGLLTQTSGRILMNGQPISGPDSSRAVVFQNDAVFPWMRVDQNIAFGPKSQGKSSSEVSALVDQYLGLTGLQDFRHAWPMTLSGGMRKRVDLARAYAADPKILLMDEPFAALDAQNRGMMQAEMIRILNEESKTVVLVTHSIEEAINLSDVIVVMTRRPGRVKKIIHVPEPRKMVEDTPAYLEIRRQIRDLIAGEHDVSETI
jgi:NitT/TauT family transport system ATP-binding protein